MTIERKLTTEQISISDGLRISNDLRIEKPSLLDRIWAWLGFGNYDKIVVAGNVSRLVDAYAETYIRTDDLSRRVLTKNVETIMKKLTPNTSHDEKGKAFVERALKAALKKLNALNPNGIDQETTGGGGSTTHSNESPENTPPGTPKSPAQIYRETPFVQKLVSKYGQDIVDACFKANPKIRNGEEKDKVVEDVCYTACVKNLAAQQSDVDVANVVRAEFFKTPVETKSPLVNRFNARYKELKDRGDKQKNTLESLEKFNSDRVFAFIREFNPKLKELSEAQIRQQAVTGVLTLPSDTAFNKEMGTPFTESKNELDTTVQTLIKAKENRGLLTSFARGVSTQNLHSEEAKQTVLSALAKAEAGLSPTMRQVFFETLFGNLEIKVDRSFLNSEIPGKFSKAQEEYFLGTFETFAIRGETQFYVDFQKAFNDTVDRLSLC